MKKSIVKIIISILCVMLVFSGCSLRKDTQIKTFNVDKDTLKVGVISDTQLPPEEGEGEEIYVKNLEKCLRVLKNREVDMILFPGDIGDLGTKYAFNTFNDVFNKVFEDDKPILQIIMGNHDYWNKNVFTAINHRKAFQDVFNESPWSHYVVNGIHFIGASPDFGSMEAAYRITSKWLDKEIQKAYDDNPNAPIFVLTHNQPKNTSYGSDDWGDKTLNKVMSKYPNVVNLSGHVHYSLLDERSIWQGDYTVVNTQSISYTEMEEGKENGTIPPKAEKTPMGYIIEINKDNFSFARINFAKGENGYEEKADKRWTFDLPYSKDSFKYTDDRVKQNAAPIMIKETGSFKQNGKKTSLLFNAGTDDDFVHSYKIVIDDKTTQLYFSDFYNGLDDMATDVVLPLKNVEPGKHNIKVYAVDSYGAESKDFVTINNVVVQ